MPHWWCRLWSARVPAPWPEGAWHCPECGRPLVGQGRPGRSSPLRWEVMTRDEQVRDCLVCGSDVGDELTPEEVRARALLLAATLERRWAKRLRGASSMYELAHWLWWLRRDPCTTCDDAEVDGLLHAIGLLLPTGERRPVRYPLVYTQWRW